MNKILIFALAVLVGCTQKPVMKCDNRVPSAELSKTISCEREMGGSNSGNSAVRSSSTRKIQFSNPEEVNREVELGYPNLFAKGAVGEIELIENEKVPVVFRRSRLPRVVELKGLAANLSAIEIYIPVKDKKSGEDMWTAWNLHAMSKAHMREAFQSPTATVITRGTLHPMDERYPRILDDVYEDLHVQMGQQVLRVSFENSGGLTTRPILHVLADEGALSLTIPSGP